MENRYAIHEQLGVGGMACVFRATDQQTGREVALKKLLIPPQPEALTSAAALFELEFHTLAQLSHPRVISVYDYGVDANGAPFYTMELLDGGDLRDHTPAPWKKTCSWLVDVCSSLALLHSRRLVHRDVSPRNIRCTRDGRAKLIDFGAMAPMSAGGARIVGTPAFIAPETFHRSALDARTDLFSLGATLYFVLTGQMPYPARSFADLVDAWQFEPMPPSTYAPEIPPELSDLVLAMLSVEPSMRPASAFEVMQRLAAVAGLDVDESDAVTRAYVATPTLVGRDTVLGALRDHLKRMATGEGGAAMLRAASGLGRSRMLDACALEAKTLATTVLRANASGDSNAFAVALALTQHLLEAQPNEPLYELYPELFERALPADRDPRVARAPRVRLRSELALAADGEQLQTEICRFMLATSEARPLFIAVDDAHRMDEPSAAVLAALIERSKTACLFVALTAENLETGTSRVLDALAPRCEDIRLTPLTRQDTRILFASVFGEVANLDMLSDEIYDVALGNPGQSLAVAEHLIDNQSIHYAGGIWTLPSHLSANDLPRSAEALIRTRIERLSDHARFLAEAQSVAYFEVFELADYHALLVGVPARTVDAAVSELFVEQALATDGRTYTLANRIWIAVLQSGIEPSQLEARHRALAELYRARSDMPLIHHLFAAGRHEEALDEMVVGLELIRSSDLNVRLEQNVHKYAADFPRAIETALKLGRSPRLVHDLRRWLVTLSVAQDASLYWQAAPYFEQLKRDSGFDLWQANIGNGNPAERLTRALSGAHERYLATPEPERVYRVDEAVKNLAEYVASSIAIGVRILDFSLLRSLPALLEPFVPLSPLLDALWQNAIATVESTCHCRFLQARSRWLKVLEKLETVDNAQFQHAATIKNAIASAVGMTEALLGLASAADRVTHLDGDPLQRVNALHLRKVVRLEQGDWNEAARLARQAEEIALRSHVTQMFMSHLRIEMQSRTKARDLVGLKQVTERIAAMAARYPGWVPCLLDAQACFHLVRGDWLAAKLGFERVIELTEPGEDLESANLATWVYAQASHAEVLLRLGDCNAARASATAALETCARRGVVSISDGLVFMLALAETKCGDPHTACARIERLIEQQIEFGVTGLKLGLIYETRAQIAIWSHDEPAFEHFARLTAHQYRYGARCPLGARYDALIHEARRYGIEPAIQVLSLEPPSAP